jgi:hypothetical protein
LTCRKDRDSLHHLEKIGYLLGNITGCATHDGVALEQEARRGKVGLQGRGGGLPLGLVARLGFLLCVAGLLLPASASALEHTFLETFGSASEPSFSEPTGLAVDQSTDDLLVIDRGAGTVSRWKPDGTPAEFTALGTNVIDGSETPQGALAFGSAAEAQIAIDNSGGENEGDIYIPQAGARAVDIFGADGEYLGQLTEYSEGAFSAFSEPCGVSVDPLGNVYVGDFGIGVHKFEPAANPPVNADNVANFAFSNSCTLAAGSGATSGFVFPAHFIGSVAKLDDTTGAEEYEISTGSTTTVSVDPATGHVFAARGEEIAEFDASGTTSAIEVSASLTGPAQGVAISGSTGNVYVTLANSVNVNVLGPLPPTVTEVSPPQGPASGGNEVEVIGTDLAKATAVKFGTTVVKDFIENTRTTIRVNAPAHREAGTVSVRVTTPGGESLNSPDDVYTYEPSTQASANANGGGSGTNSGPPPQAAELKAGAIAAFSRGKVALHVTCAGGSACIGSLTLQVKAKGKNRVIGTAPYNVGAGMSKTIKVKITNDQIRKRLKEGRSVSATVSGQGVKQSTVKLKGSETRRGASRERRSP